MQMGNVTRLPLLTVMTAVIAFGLVTTTGTAWAQDEEGSSLEAIVVTGNIAGEERARSTASIWVIDEETIEKTNASSVAELLSNAGIGFATNWSPNQSSINIRGGNTDYQGMDMRSRTMVLVNGRRAGTANLTRLSPNEVKRIEVMRGPASVMYGSQALGGIVNIILKDGRNTEGGLVDVRVGSSGLVQTHAEYARTWGEDGAVATYLGGDWATKDDYEGGKGAGTQLNTAWNRKGGLGDIIWQINESNELQLTLRSDGVYDAGFRGSKANITAKDSRSNQSLDLIWNFDSADLPVKWRLHNYLVYDEDHFKWTSPVEDVSKDENERRLYIMGVKFTPIIALSDSNDLLLGVDYEQSKLNTPDRVRLRNNGTPYANTRTLNLNQTEKVAAFYIEDTQRLFNDRLILRGGIRHTRGTLNIDPTQGYTPGTLGSQDYDATTWSVGANFEATEHIFLRAGAATGFRAPIAAELAGQTSFLSSPEDIAFGNPNVTPESSQQYEIGMFVRDQGWFLDLALFHNEIENFLTTQRITNTSGTSGTWSRYVNSDGKYVITGMELGSRIDIDQVADLGNWKLAFGLNGTYNFEMEDESKADRNRTEMQRVYKYQASFYTQFGKDSTVANPWSVRLTGIYRGPMYYDTEEWMKEPEFRPDADYVFRKSPFMVWNLNGELDLSEQWSVYAGINNLLDKNEHPTFIAIDDGTEYTSRNNGGGFGTSMPGREFYLGLKFAF